MLAAVGPWLVRKRRGRFGSPEASRADISRRLRMAAEHLGPTYIKLGQIISSGEGLFPEELVERVQEVPRPGAGRAVRTVVRDVVEAELGATARGRVLVVRPRSRSPRPRSPRCTRPRLRTGEPVVVKVQRPVGRHARAHRTCGSWRGWRPFLVGRIPIAALANPPALVELFAETITEELDFRLEAENMLDVARRASPTSASGAT